MDHENGCSLVPAALYRLEFFMWQLGCWDIHPRGCALIKDGSSGLTYTPLPVASDLLFTRGLAATSQLCFLVSLSLPTTPWGCHMPWLTPDLSGLLQPLSSSQRVRMIANNIRVTCAPPKWRLYPWAFGGRIFQVDSVKTSCQKWPTLCVILKQ